MAKTYTAFSRNVGPDLQKAVPSKVEIGAFTLKVDLTLEDAGYKKVTSSPVWLQKVNDTANKIVPGVIAAIADEIKKAKSLDEKSLKDIIEKNGDAAADKLADAIEKALEQWVKDKKEYTSYKVRSAGKIVLGVVGVVGSAVSIGLTAGAASPVAIIGLARSGIGLAQNIAKVALEAEGVERLIRVDIVVLTKAFAKNKDNKEAQNMKELGLAAIAAVIGVDTPTISNCEGRIELYHNKITGLKKDQEKFAATIYKLLDLEESLRGKVTKTAKEAKNYDKLSKTLAIAEKTLETVVKQVANIGERIEKAEKNHKAYSKFVDALKMGVSGWTKYAQAVISFGIDLGSGVGDAASSIEKGLTALQTILTAANDQLLEKV